MLGSSMYEIMEFFLSEHGGVLLLSSSFSDNRRLCGGCICNIRKIEDNVTYVKFVTICKLSTRQTVYNIPERKFVVRFSEERGQE
jgi:hypothetical protein